MRGHTYKRCPCPAVALRNADGKRVNCPKRHGSWFYAHELAPGPDGKRRQTKRGGFATERGAQRALTDALDRVGKGTYIPAGKTTVGAYLATWLAAKADLRATTRLSYAGHVEKHLVPLLGGIRLDELRPEDIERAYAAILAGNAERERPIGPTSLRRIHATLSSALNSAVRKRRLTWNPAAHVDLARRTRPKVQPWSADELGQFLDVVDDDRLRAL